MPKIVWGVIISGILILAVMAVKKVFPSVQDDSVLEESVEEVIKDTTGADVDLTPGSPELPKLQARNSRPPRGIPADANTMWPPRDSLV